MNYIILIAFLIAGAVAGALTVSLCKMMICKRTKQPITSKILSAKWAYKFWMIVGGVTYTIIYLAVSANAVRAVECCILFTLCLMIAIVDQLIRKIPNELLLAMLVLKVIFLIFNNNKFFVSIVGLFVGLIVFSLPSYVNLSIGNGDIKYGAVAGFYFGIGGLLQIMIIMATALLIYWTYLKIAKKGTMKTSAPMGPYISIGILVTSLFSIITL